MEQEKPQEAKLQEVKENTASSVLDKANAAADRLEKANKQMEEYINKVESLQAEQLLAGKADAGTMPNKKEESASDYAKKVMSNEAAK